jgi:hypothetical protein
MYGGNEATSFLTPALASVSLQPLYSQVNSLQYSLYRRLDGWVFRIPRDIIEKGKKSLPSTLPQSRLDFSVVQPLA